MTVVEMLFAKLKCLKVLPRYGSCRLGRRRVTQQSSLTLATASEDQAWFQPNINEQQRNENNQLVNISFSSLLSIELISYQ